MSIVGDSLMTNCLGIGMSEEVMNDCAEADAADFGGHGGHGGHGGGFRRGGVGFVAYGPYYGGLCWDPIIQEHRPCWEF